MPRRKTKKIKVGDIYIGGDAPITVQTMVKGDAHNVPAVVAEIKRAQEAGCDIIRMNVLDMESVQNFSKIKKLIDIPIVADIHFSHEWAKEAIRQGVDKLRINPGNIGSKEKVREVVSLAKKHHVPIRIGVNAGSLEKDLIEKYGFPTPEGIVESAERHIKILEDLDYDQIIVSLKSSDVRMMVQAYRMFSEKFDYPVHLGVTEAGPYDSSAVKSSIGIGSLLLDGIGDTLRVSISGDALDEIKVGKNILKFLSLGTGPIIVSCPTCSRTQFDMIPLVKRLEEYLIPVKKNIKIAVMGCVVNGPGEAREADVGIAGGKDKGVLFAKGKVVKIVEEKDMFTELVHYIETEL